MSQRMTVTCNPRNRAAIYAQLYADFDIADVHVEDDVLTFETRNLEQTKAVTTMLRKRMAQTPREVYEYTTGKKE